jgi:hypothetical protein
MSVRDDPQPMSLKDSAGQYGYKWLAGVHI